MGRGQHSDTAHTAILRSHTPSTRSCNKHPNIQMRFYIKKSNKAQYYCPKCNSESASRRRKKRREEALKLLGGRCKKCGYKKYKGALHLHHTGEKQFTINQILTHNKQKLLKELKNCILLCGNCHMEEHSFLTDGLEKHVSDIHAHRRKIALINAFGGECSLCPEDNLKMLTFHHLVPGDKKTTLTGNFLKTNYRALWEEANKCILLCFNCHAEVEAGLHPDKNIQWIRTSPHAICSFQDWKDLVSDQSTYTGQPRKTPKYCIDCPTKIDYQATRCIKCHRLHSRIAERPSKERLLYEIKTLGYCGTGRKYKVSDNAIRKWIKAY